MNTYFSTFFTGFGEVIIDELVRLLNDVEIIFLTDGLVIYKTAKSINVVKTLKFFNKSFVLVRKFEGVDKSDFNKILKSLIDDKEMHKILTTHFSNSHYKFRIRASYKNQYIPIDKNQLHNLEIKITKSVKHFKVNRSLPNLELLITIRSEGIGLVGLQFTHRPNYEKTLQKGELYPELAYILCLISKPTASDIFLDPFTGYGSIPHQRLNFPLNKIIACEINNDLIKKLSSKFNNQIEVVQADALKISTKYLDTIDKIVTDPPWGLYELIDIHDFYTKMLTEFVKILKPSGIIVLLTSQKELMNELLKKFQGELTLTARYNTLISGKKATVYRLKRN